VTQPDPGTQQLVCLVPHDVNQIDVVTGREHRIAPLFVFPIYV